MDTTSLCFGIAIGLAIGVYIGLKIRRTPIAAPFEECPQCKQPVRTGSAVCHHCQSKLA